MRKVIFRPQPANASSFRPLHLAGILWRGPFRQMYEDMQGGEYLDELPDYVASRETPATNPVLAKKYPLNIISPKSHGFLNSCYAEHGAENQRPR